MPRQALPLACHAAAIAAVLFAVTTAPTQGSGRTAADDPALPGPAGLEELPELAAMFGLPTGVRESMAELATMFGLSMIALTRGAGGSLLMADGIWSDDPGRPVAVSDTIGAGDAFTAALVVGRLAGRSLDAINRHASEVAAFVCSQPGGTPTLPEALRFPTEDRSNARP